MDVQDTALVIACAALVISVLPIIWDGIAVVLRWTLWVLVLPLVLLWMLVAPSAIVDRFKARQARAGRAEVDQSFLSRADVSRAKNEWRTK